MQCRERQKGATTGQSPGELRNGLRGIPLAETGIASTHNRLRAAADAKFAEDYRNIVAYRALANAKARSDSVIVQALRHELQHVAFPRCKIIEPTVRRTGSANG